MNPATNALAGSLVQLARRGELLDDAAVHHGDAVGHRHGLLLIVRHVDERGARALLEVLQLELHLLAELQVERAQRLVEQEGGGPVHERAGERDPLLLAAGELRRTPVLHAVELHGADHLARPASRSPTGRAS